MSRVMKKMLYCPDCKEVCRTEHRLLNHILKAHVKTNAKRVGGGPLGSTSKTATKKSRNDTLKLSFPKVVVPKKVELLSDPGKIIQTLDPLSSKISPPISIIDDIANQVDKSVHAVHVIELDYGTYSWPEFLKFKNVFAQKEIRNEILEEQKWLDGCKVLSQTQYEKQLDLSDIANYIDIIQNSSSPVKIGKGKYNIEELKTLCCSRWLSMECIMYIAKLLKVSKENKNTVILNANDILEKEKLLTTISNLQDQYGKRMKGITVILVMHLGCSKNGAYISSFGKPGNHFSLATYDIGKGIVLYADSLAWQIPKDLVHMVNVFALQTSNILPTFKACHSIQCSNENKCSSECASYYPRQTCSSACGVAVIMGMILCYLYPEDFTIMSSSNLNNEQIEKIKPYVKLSDITKHSAYFRCCIMSWLMKGKVDTGNFLCFKSLNKCKMPSRSSHIPKHKGKKKCSNNHEFVENSNKDDIPSVKKEHDMKPWHVVKKMAIAGKTYEYAFDFSKIQKYLKRKPSVFYRNPKQTIDLECLLINGVRRTKTFKVVSGVQETLVLVQIFVNNDGEEWLASHRKAIGTTHGVNGNDNFTMPETEKDLYYRCEFDHVKSKSQIRITVHLLDGTSKYKVFNCSDVGYDDEQCVREIQYFLDNEFRTFLGEKWEKIATIPVGSSTREYIDSIPFNTKVKWFVHDDIDVVEPPNVALVSLNEHPRWGKTKRVDSTFCLGVENKCNNNQEVVRLTLKCCAQTDSCKTLCGGLLKELPPISVKSPTCTNCGKDVSAKKECFNCMASYSSRWGKQNGLHICNNCLVYFNKHSEHRHLEQFESNSTVQRHPHILCRWKIKFVLMSSNLNEWIVYHSANNGNYHEGDAKQEGKKMSLTVRDRIDEARVLSGATPRQLELSLSTPIKVNDQSIPPTLTKEQVKHRMEVIDKHILGQSMGNGVHLSKSQWENTEKLLTQNHSKVLFFQRGDQEKQRNYHIIMGSDENLQCLSEYGKHICGYDIKHDFNEMRLKTGAFTYSDALGKGRVGAFTISNSETAQTHLLNWQIILSNLKCSKEDCLHDRKLCVFDDGNGFMRYRPCVLENGPEFVPFLQHDKDTSLLNAAKGMNTRSSLCNFHGLQCIRDVIKQPKHRELQKFMEPLVFGFKCIMRTYNTPSRHQMQNEYIAFINDNIPNDIVPMEEKSSFLEYLTKCWFNSRWSDTFTAEVLYATNSESRKNPLILTNNSTERKFRDIDESVFKNKMNKLVSKQVQQFLDILLPSEEKLTKQSKSKFEIQNNQIKQPLTWRTKLLIKKALELIDQDDIRILPGTNNHGWTIIDSSSVRHVDDEILRRTFENSIELSDENSSSDEENSSVIYRDEFGMLGQTGAEHSYSSISSAIRLVSTMKRALSQRYKGVLMANAPEEVREASYSGHVCNLKMGVCSCVSFINMGQPKFCKHLFASLALEQRLRDEKTIFAAFVNHIPELPHSIPQPKLYSEIQADKKNINWSPIDNIIQFSHLPSKDEEKALRMGVLVSDAPNQNVDATSISSSIGRPKGRVAHRGGFRKQLNDTFLPNVAMPRDSRKRKADSQQGSSQRRQVKKRKEECGSMYNEQLKTLATSQIQSTKAQLSVSNQSPDICNQKKTQQNPVHNQNAESCITQRPEAFQNPLSNSHATFQQSPMPLQIAPMVLGQFQSQVNIRQVWLNINGSIQLAYIV